MNPITNTAQTVRSNIDAKIVTSVVAGLAAFGAITFLAVKSGVKPLAAAAKVAKGGK